MWRISGEVGVLVMYRFIAASPLAALCLGCWERGGVSNKPIVDRFKSEPHTKPQRRVIEAREATPVPNGFVAIVPRNRPSDILQDLDCVHPHAAGLDIGSETIVAAVPPDRGKQFVRAFATFT